MDGRLGQDENSDLVLKSVTRWRAATGPVRNHFSGSTPCACGSAGMALSLLMAVEPPLALGSDLVQVVSHVVAPFELDCGTLGATRKAEFGSDTHKGVKLRCTKYVVYCAFSFLICCI